MTIEFTYRAEDFEEATAARTAALNESKGRRRGNTDTRRGVIGWLLFLALCFALSFMVRRQGRLAAAGRHIHFVEPAPTHNFLQTLLVAVAAPLITLSFVAWGSAQAVSSKRVPFYTAKLLEPPIARTIWRIAAWMSIVLGIGAVVGVFVLPDAPGWRPDVGSLLIVLLGPWICWFLLILYATKWAKKRARRGLDSTAFGVEGTSIRLPIRLDLDAEGVLASTSYSSHRMTWPYFVSYLESENLLSLYTRDLTVHVIPKRALTEPGSFERLCGLVHTKISAGQFLPRNSAFAVVQPPPLPVQALPVSEPFADP